MVADIEDKITASGWTIAKEQLFDTETELLRPDLVIKTPGKGG